MHESVWSEIALCCVEQKTRLSNMIVAVAPNEKRLQRCTLVIDNKSLVVFGMDSPNFWGVFSSKC